MLLSLSIQGSFRWRVFQTFFTQILIVILGLVSSIVTARLLGPEGRGIFVFLGTVVATLIQFGNLGLHASNTYYLAREPGKLSHILGNSVMLSLLGGTLLAGIGGIATFFADVQIPGSARMLHIALVGVPFGLLYLFVSNLFLAQGETTLFNLLEFSSRFLNATASVIALAVFHVGVSGLVTVVTAATAMTALVVLAVCATRYKTVPSLHPSSLLRHMSYGSKAYLAALFSFLVIRSDVYLVNYFLGPTSTGVYSLAVQVGDMLLLLPLAIGTIFFPTAARMQTGKWEFMTRVARKTALIMSLAALGVGLSSRLLIQIFYGQSFLGAVPALQLLLPGLVFLGINTVFNNFLAAEGMPSIVVWAPLLGLMLNVAGNLWTIRLWGINGAAFMSTATYFCVFLVMGFYVWHRKERFTIGR